MVLAGRLGTEGLSAENLRAEPTKPRQVPEYRSDPRPAPAIKVAPPPSATLVPASEPSSWLRPVPGASLTYDTVGQPRALRLEPLYRIFDERYAVYWKGETT